MGVVYLAEDLNLERIVAVKFLPKLVSENTEERQRFKVEIKITFIIRLRIKQTLSILWRT